MRCSGCAPCVIDPRGSPQGTLQCSPWAHHQHRILGFGCGLSQTRVLSPSWVSFPSIFMAPPSRVQMDIDIAFPGHPCMDPAPLALGGTSGTQSHGKRSPLPHGKTLRQDLLSTGALSVSARTRCSLHTHFMLVFIFSIS